MRQCNGVHLGGFTLYAYEQRNSNPIREDVFGDSGIWLDVGHWLYDMLGVEAGTNKVVRFVTSAEYYEPGHDEELGTFDDLLLKITGPGYAELLSSYRPPEKLAKDPYWLFLKQAGLR